MSKVPPKSTAHGGGSTPAILEEAKKEDPHKLHSKGPGHRTSLPLPPLATPKLASGDLEKVMQEKPRPAVRMKSNAVKGLPRELSFHGHEDDDDADADDDADITMASLTERNELSQTKVMQEEPRPAVRIKPNAVKGLPRELSFHGQDDDDDDDITMASLTEKNELPQTKEIHKRQVVDAFGEQGLYTGSVNGKSHLPDGYGEMQYREKRSYEGDWSQGHWHGHGQFINSVEDVYEGEFVMDRKEGQGKLIFNDGRFFTGRFQNYQMREGKLHFQDASFYQGLLRDGKRSGFGLYVFSDQSQYEGQWESDCMHGRGRMDWSDGGWYNGQWEVGVQHGTGMEVLPDGTLKHRGRWHKGNPVQEAVPIG
jgi:hypothetical protein